MKYIRNIYIDILYRWLSQDECIIQTVTDNSVCDDSEMNIDAS